MRLLSVMIAAMNAVSPSATCADAIPAAPTDPPFTGQDQEEMQAYFDASRNAQGVDLHAAILCSSSATYFETKAKNDTSRNDDASDLLRAVELWQLRGAHSDDAGHELLRKIALEMLDRIDSIPTSASVKARVKLQREALGE